MQKSSNNAIILFDGVCSFCDASVQFVLQRDPAGYFNYASLQSPLGQALIKQYDLPNDLTSIVLIENQQAFLKSTAVLKIARRLSGSWKLLYGFMLVPGSLRDIVYNWIANHRYEWFGKKELACELPAPSVRKRFLT